MRTCVWLLDCPLPRVSLYFFIQSFFHLFLMSTLVPDENSMKDPLCNSSFGSMVSLDYVTPDTLLRLLIFGKEFWQDAKNSTLFVFQKFCGQTLHERRANTNGETSFLSDFHKPFRGRSQKHVLKFLHLEY